MLYALDRLFDPLPTRRDTLLHTLGSAVGGLNEAAGRMYVFNARAIRGAWRGFARETAVCV